MLVFITYVFIGVLVAMTSTYFIAREGSFYDDDAIGFGVVIGLFWPISIPCIGIYKLLRLALRAGKK